MNKTVIIAVIAAVVLLGVVIYATTSVSPDEDTDPSTENTTQNNDANNNDSTVVAGDDDSDAGFGVSGSINSVVLEPTETGNFVNVRSATLVDPGFVVVYQVKSNNDTEVIGSSDLLLPGSYEDITIQLDTVIAFEQTVVAVLHEDDGDGEFSFPESDFYLGNAGDPIVSDVDVVDVPQDKENEALQEQVELYLEENHDSSAAVESS